ncbi:hypothetical protein N7539_007256 [Penicillium diatomitis]|uniref:Xylanolytic transcriptional activator regulatory domain-containing protein n=1 Tax=Penicillium diatomitis TaxID=2819901 RepID=A0A9X0BNZ8_9EURO|nr:uncharacterized protein N7539_007256 [Penicillium diatomitis]KAJ5477112.1 hypothetical protein N7539_007256 [Penicillium diatomitis]
MREKIEKQCIFYEVPKDPVAERLEAVESELASLRTQLREVHEDLRKNRTTPAATNQNIAAQQYQPPTRSSHREILNSDLTPPLSRDVGGIGRASVGYERRVFTNEVNGHNLRRVNPASTSPGNISTQLFSSAPERQNTKRKRSCFEIRDEAVVDFIAKGLISKDSAIAYFDTFFEGCDRYIPIFDPEFDTFDSVRDRSSILLNALCTIGSMIRSDPDGSMSEILHRELKKWINVIIQNRSLNSLESVQAMLVVSCYSADRLLILSFATRMALDLGLHEAFQMLTDRLVIRNDHDAWIEDGRSGSIHDVQEERLLMRKSRTWFGLLVLEHIFRVDAGKPPGIRFLGNARRCRILLSHPASTILDLRLFSQVELNILRATINDTLTPNTTLSCHEVSDFVHETKTDLDLWFDDWLRIIGNCKPAKQECPYLLVALRVQKCWAEMMLNCKALRAMGVENVAAMTPNEQEILLAAKAAARRHLNLIIFEPNYYLAKLKYAMDFVWAKCAFSFLLLLKLSRLLPDRDEQHRELLDQGKKLIEELSGASSSSNQPDGGNIYLQILKVSIEKFERALEESRPSATEGPINTSPFWELFDAQADLQCFMPEQFVSEWEFPGLNLFFFPTAMQDFFGDFSLAM